MGVLRRRDAPERTALGNRFLVGRSGLAQLRLFEPKVSSEHASIYYNVSAQTWEVRDLGSTNGTLLNGAPLPGGRGVRLQKGDVLCFGDASQTFELVDDAPPGPSARDADGADTLRADQGILWLDDSERDGACVYLSEDGWVLEERGGQRVVENGERVRVRGRTFVLELPPKESVHDVANTVADDHSAPEPRLVFRVSRDQEQVHLVVHADGQDIDLGVRSHHDLLLTLARHRRKDEQRGLSEAEAGWVYSDELARMLALDPEHANVMVFRARDQFRRKGLDASRLIERRPTSRQLRFGFRAFDVQSRADS